MATPKFIENTQGTFTNNTNEFILMLATDVGSINPLQMTGPSGIIYSIQDNGVSHDSTAYPLMNMMPMRTTAIIPPRFTVQVKFIGLQGSLEDLRGYI